MKARISALWSRLTDGITARKIFYIILGAMICSFGIHNIHQRTNITEGGVIGMMLLIDHWLHLSPAYITPVLDASCYLLAFKILGGNFIKMSLISTSCISLFYKLWEQFPPMLPDLSGHPLIAAVLGGLFVGVGVGLIVRQGGSSAETMPCAGDRSSDPLAAVPLVSVYRPDGAGFVPQLYPRPPDRVFPGHGDYLVLPDRLDQGL